MFRKQDPNNLRSKNKTQSIVFTGKEVLNEVSDCIQQPLVQTDKNIKIQDVITNWLKKVKVPAAVRIEVDIDPYSFY